MNRAWILAHHPQDMIGDALLLREVPLPVPAEGEVLIRVKYLSVDPGQRTWMRAEGSYMAALDLGSAMPGSVLGQVVESRAPDLQPGDLVSGMGLWADHCILRRRELRRVRRDGATDPLATLSVLGATGWTAYFGLVDIGRPKAGDTLVVSAAAGAVGSIVGQIGRALGCRVIGIAGSEAKCRWLTEELGFDAAIDYRTEDVDARLEALCPNAIDIYFENVGGAIGQAAYSRMATHGRIVLCGLVSGYQGAGTPSAIDLADLLMKRVRVEAFVVTDYFTRLGEAIGALEGWLADGSLHYHVDVVDGLENSVDALNSLLGSGDSHRGKLLVKVADRTI